MQLPWFSTNTGNLANTLQLLQTQWRAILNPLLANQLNQGQLLNGIVLADSTSNVINHKLGRQMVGWFIVDQDAAAQIYRAKPLNSTTLTLASNAAVTVNLWVF